MVKVAKFGGSSVASAEQFKKVKNIVELDPARKLVVVSAIGKADNKDNKITDLLYLCYAHIKYNISTDTIFSMIENKYLTIADELGLTFDIQGELTKLKNELTKDIDEEYLVSRGEYLTGLLMAEYLGYYFVDAKNLIFFNYQGKIDYGKTQDAFNKLIKKHDKLLIPGFYGSLPNGEIKIMSRGGGDVTGAIIANIADAEVYENWTDVSGILMADPRIIKNPREIKVINYSELRELSYMGASVLHEEAIFPVRDKEIPIQIKNTNNPKNTGTIISDNADIIENKNIVTGIAGKKNFSIITIKKNHMANEIGLVGKVLKVLEEYHVNIEHIPSGIDSFSIVVETNTIKPFIHELVAKIKNIIQADEINVTNEISLIATVGEKMKNSLGLSARLFGSLGKAGVNIALISQTNDEINIIIGVHNNDYEKTITALYNEFK
ncbi:MULTISPECIES: aspartate kinase [Gemella]|uniref:aspartate kinase n=1 Tax=Gemella TaxID=1378 RepID=UPI000767E29D|nr:MULTISPECIES: aspartate kinase [Gemella]AME08971.1 aspartate kinase [Gemella sp. oral taxon 928]AXI26541.1 aspartate kinase [Gemella sp. ND 6198]